MAMMEIKSTLSTRERLIFALLWLAFFLVLARLAMVAPASLLSAAAFTGVCAGLSLIFNRGVRLPLRVAGLTIPAMLLAAGKAHAIPAGSVAAAAVLAGVALVGGVGSLVSAPVGLRAYRAWMHAAAPIGWVVSHVVLGIVYFGVFTPIALIMRLAGRDALQLRLDKSQATYWSARRPTTDPRRYLRQS